MSIANPHFSAHSETPAALRLKRRAAVASIAVGGTLIIAKIYAYASTQAVSMLASMMDSFFDVFASIITLVSVIHAARPADHHHRYGHGKIEALSALAQAVFIFATAIMLIYKSVARIADPVVVDDAITGIAVCLLSIVMTAGLLAYQRHVIRQTQSVAISADKLHYSGDLLMNMGVIAALLLTTLTGYTAIDALFAFGIALHLLRGVWKIGRTSVDILMDRELDAQTRADIMALITRHPAAVAVHDLRTRDTGERIFIECHLEMDGNLTLNQAHTVTEDIERMIFDAYPASEVIIHQEPAGLDDHRLDDKVG